MDLNQKVISRSGYTVLDLISDIGGMQGVLISFFAIIVGVWNHNMIDNHLVSRLYMLESRPNPNKPRHRQPSTPGRFISMMPRASQNMLEFLKDSIIGWKCLTRCCKPNHFYHGFELAREKLKMETNIIEIIKKLRYYEIALNALTTRQQRVQFKALSRYKCISLDELDRGDDQTSDTSQN